MGNSELYYAGSNDRYHFIYFKIEKMKNDFNNGEMHLFEFINETNEVGIRTPSMYLSQHNFIISEIEKAKTLFKIKFIRTPSLNPSYFDPYLGVELTVSINKGMEILESTNQLSIPLYYNNSSYEQFLQEIQNMASILEERRSI